MAQTYSHGNNTNAFGMVMLGAALGAMAALLMAPKKGEDMREDIKGRYNDTMTKTQEKMDTAKDKMMSATGKLRSKTDDTAKSGMEAIDQAAEKAKDSVDRTAGQTEEMLDKTATSTRNSRKST